MDLKDYQDRTKDTAIYPLEVSGYYPILARCGEVGELANVFKKSLRGDYDRDTPEFRAKIMDELGDILWYLARTAGDFGMDLNDVAKFNLKKLKLRKETGRLKTGAATS